MQIVWLAILVLAGGAGALNPLHLGAEFSAADETPIEEIVANPERYHNCTVKTSGIIASVCNEEGCFIEIVPRGGGPGIVANFPGLVHTFPTDCAGLAAVVEGVFYRKIYHSARVSHWQHHSYHVGRAIPDFSMILRIEVAGARIAGPRADIPGLAEIPPVSPFKVNLNREEFEDEGFGIGKKHLEAGVTRHQPASSAVRTLVVCINGSVSVTRQGGPAMPLEQGGMAYIPQGTRYELLAKSADGADVLIIYADIIKKESEHRH